MINIYIAAYQDILIGRSGINTFSNLFAYQTVGGKNQMHSLEVIRYCIENIMYWNPKEAYRKFDMKTIELMQLDRVTRYIDFPVEISDVDPKYILHLLYPDIFKLSYERIVIENYKKVLNGEKKFVREYFLGQEGFYRFSCCLKYLFENVKIFTDLQELYGFILSPDGNKFLAEKKLGTPADHYSINILDCVHYITSSANQEMSDILYSMYKFKAEWDRVLKERNELKQNGYYSVIAPSV